MNKSTKNQLRKTVYFLLALLLLLSCFPGSFPITAGGETSPEGTLTEEAPDALLPAARDNLANELRRTSYLMATDDGYMRLFYDDTKICIEYYDDEFNIQSKRSIALELPIWGGFYAGKDAYYLIEGQSNPEQKSDAEVVRVIRYDSDWNRTGAAAITGDLTRFGGDVRYPFTSGCIECNEYDGTLFIVTGHEGYVDSMYGQGHQGFLMLAVDEASMTGKIVASDLSHSFAQYIDRKDSTLYVLEQCEGYRQTKLTRYSADRLNDSKSISVLDYGGSRTSAWAIPCYASVDGIALSGDSVLCIGTSIDQSKYDTLTREDPHNIYLTVTPMADFSKSATAVKQLTNYTGDEKCFLGVNIIKINDDRFLVIFEEYDTEQTPADSGDPLSGYLLHYLFIDGNGNKLSDEFTAAAPISACQPVVKGSKIVYYASSGNTVNFYTIDSTTGAFSKKVYRVAGENVTWDLRDGVLTLSGRGGISVDTEPHFRFPVSYVNPIFSFSSLNNCWKTIREQLKYIEIGDGITKIPDAAFNYFDALIEVRVGKDVTAIGAKAFAFNKKLKKITIPPSVKSIGEDVVWSGYLWATDESGHVFFAVIYGEAGSYAQTYAEKYGVSFVAIGSTPDGDLLGDLNGDGKITGADRTYLARVIAGWDGYSAKLAVADVNGDGRVTSADRTYLARVIAGWKGFALPSSGNDPSL